MGKNPRGKPSTLSSAQLEALERHIESAPPVHTNPDRAIGFVNTTPSR